MVDNFRYIYFFIFCVITPVPAHAYIDPSIFTFLWQGLVLIATSIFIFFKDVRNQITSLFNHFFKKRKK